MRKTVSPFAKVPYGLSRVCRAFEIPRSTIYARVDRIHRPVPLKKRGPKAKWSDEMIVERIRGILGESNFLGEGHRKVWARLRAGEVRAGKTRVLRLMRENHLLSPTQLGHAHGPKAHDGVITTEAPNVMWGTDATTALTRSDGTVTVFIAVDHFNSECVGIHCAKPGTRFEALEPIRQGIREQFLSFRPAVADELALRHDNGPQYTSAAFQNEIRLVGIESSPAFVREPEGNGCSERFIRTLKEQLLWVRTFETVEELRLALHEFRVRYNHGWLVARHGYRTPTEIRASFRPEPQPLAA